MPQTVRFPLILAALAGFSLLPKTAPAVTTNWNITNGYWPVAVSWDNGVPDAGDTAVFRRGNVSPYSVGIRTFPDFSPINPTINRLIIGTNTVFFGGHPSSTLTIAEVGRLVKTGGDMIIGQTSTDVAVLNSTIASLTVDDATLGSAAGSSGTLNLTQNNDAFMVTGATNKTYDLTVGASGTGAINISGGADVTVANATILGLNGGSTGNVSVNGSGSTWTNTGTLIVGSSGIGSLSISAGGIVESPASLLGANVQGEGHVIMSGGCEWNMSGSLYVGYAGTGSIDVTGGRITSGFASFGNTSGFAGNVAISGLISRWDISGPLYIWNGTLAITNSATVEGHYTTNGPPTMALIGNTSAVTVSGATWNTEGSLSIYSGGTLTITNRGYVGIRGGGIGFGSSGFGDVTIEGAFSQLESFGGLGVGSDLAGGRLTLRDGGRATATSPVVVGGLGEIRGNGYVAAEVQNGGLVSPGMSAGSLHFQHDYIQTAAGELLIELASATSFDQLLISNDATLDGTLTVTLLDGFVPSINQSFTIFTADDVDGTFSTEVLPSVPNLVFEVIYNADSVVLTILSAGVPGDFDGDGDVDGADFVAWQTHFPTASGATLADGDADGDGDVDGADFVVWQTNFPFTPGPGVAPVPEPNALFLLSLTTLALLFLLNRSR